MSFIEHDDDVDVTADVALRVNAVEELVNRDNRLLSRAEKAATFTVGAELGAIADGRQRRWTMVNESDVEAVATSILNEFRGFGLPYLERESNLETLLTTISGSGRESWLHSPVHDARYKRALALALVLGKPDQARAIGLAGEGFLRERDDPGLPSFLHFRDSLVGTDARE